MLLSLNINVQQSNWCVLIAIWGLVSTDAYLNVVTCCSRKLNAKPRRRSSIAAALGLHTSYHPTVDHQYPEECLYFEMNLVDCQIHRNSYFQQTMEVV